MAIPAPPTQDDLQAQLNSPQNLAAGINIRLPQSALQAPASQAAPSQSYQDFMAEPQNAAYAQDKRKIAADIEKRQGAIDTVRAHLDQEQEKLKDVPEKIDQSFQNPLQAFSELGPAIAMLGSLKSRQPMIAAMHAAAGAMDAFHKNDKERLDLELQNWQTKVDEVLKHNAYVKDDANMDHAKLEAIYAQNKDEIGLLSLQDPKDTEEMFFKKQEMMAKLKEMQAKIESYKFKGQLSNGLVVGGVEKQVFDRWYSDQMAKTGEAPTPREMEDKLAEIRATNAGATASARALGTKGAVIELSSNLLNNSLPILKDSFAKVDNSKFKDLNSFQNYFKDHSNDPDLAALNEAILNTESDLALLIRRGGASTVDSATRAEKIINNAMNSKSFDAVSEQILRESEAAKKAERQTRSEVSGGSAPKDDPNRPLTPQELEEYNKLKGGK